MGLSRSAREGDHLVERRRLALEEAEGQPAERMAGRQDAGQRLPGEGSAEHPLGRRIGERRGAVRPEEDDGVLEALCLVRGASPRRGGLDSLPDAAHPLREAAHVVAGPELDGRVPPGQALDPAGDPAQVAEEDPARPEPEGDRQAKGARTERKAPEESVPERLADEARGHADLHGPEGLVAVADGEADLVDLRRPEESPRELRKAGGEDVVQEWAVRELLTLEARVVNHERPALRVDDRAVHDHPGVTDDAVQQRAETRVVPEGRRPGRTRRLQNMGGLMKELAREEVALVRRAAEREPRQGGEVRGRRDRDHEQDDEGEAEELPRPGAQRHAPDRWR